MNDCWEIYALKYAQRNTRTRNDSFIMDDDHKSPHPMDYYVWILRSGSNTILVDTGYEELEAKRRNRAILANPVTLLEDFGIGASSIDTIIVTHLHYDHAGGLKSYPNAQLHVQAAEMAYATGPCMCSDHLRIPFTGEHICDAVRALYEGRVTFSEGSSEIAPGVETHLIGGHSRGLQAVRVWTRRGWVVLASDASHYYENYERKKPFPIVVDLESMLSGFDTLRELADSDQHIIPGHDPLVRARYPAHNGQDDIVLLHADPLP
ncbi:MAG: N-acyl homoserine lactonase family protein [Gammaproteobacteria bacterium]|nr:N-acyl homoserine lactonase family protein [Gammaproteobacteria bacterium]